ncbi:hypothetical protein, partial [Tahibacter soli]
MHDEMDAVPEFVRRERAAVRIATDHTRRRVEPAASLEAIRAVRVGDDPAVARTVRGRQMRDVEFPVAEMAACGECADGVAAADRHRQRGVARQADVGRGERQCAVVQTDAVAEEVGAERRDVFVRPDAFVEFGFDGGRSAAAVGCFGDVGERAGRQCTAAPPTSPCRYIAR